MSQYEVETKFRVSSFDATVTAVERLGGRFEPAFTQVDRYFNHPSRDFAGTDEALRIRTTDQAVRLTYKGPRRAGPVKLRQEIELQVGQTAADAEQLCQLWQALGFREVATVRKQRRCAELRLTGRRYEIALDDVEDVGIFVEVETLVTDADTQSAAETVLQLSARLGLQDVEPSSYLELLLRA